MTNKVVRQNTKQIDKLLMELVTSENAVYGSIDGLIDKQVNRIFTIADDQYFKQFLHINKDKIIVVTK
jgi:hypothetical protein